MAATIHAVLLLAMPVAAGLICLFGPRRHPHARRPAVAALIAGGSALLTLVLNTHLCRAGEPVAQCCIGGASAWLLLTFPRSGWIRGGLGIACVAIMAGLSVQYVGLVHTRAWYGHPAAPREVQIVNETRRSHLNRKIGEIGQGDATMYPAGWLRQMPFAAAVQSELSTQPYRAEGQRAWHSWYTRLYPVRRVEQDFWFSGGRLTEPGDLIVLKDVP